MLSEKTEPSFFNHVHHVAIITSDYEKSKHFYTEILRIPVIRETFRKERQSYKLDLQVNATTQLELFSFPDPPKRPSRPEACGLRHLAFAVEDLGAVVDYLKRQGVDVEPVRVDELTGCQFTFFADPDNLPLELYETR